jgi:hypothetical protein
MHGFQRKANEQLERRLMLPLVTRFRQRCA